MQTRPVLFVGSSSEGLEYAKAIQQNLDRICQVVVWTQGVFGIGGGTLEALVDSIGNVDFGVLVVTPDDLVNARGKRVPAPRDNVLLELGICIGMLGPNRTFLFFDRTKDIKLPSDLAGVTMASFAPHEGGNLVATLGAACTDIEQKITRLGVRAKFGKAGIIHQDTQFRIIADLLGVVAVNYLIQISELRATLERERHLMSSFGDYWYGIDFPGKHVGNGRFSVDDLCQKMPDAGIISQDLKFNVGLTDHGKDFVRWLVRNGYKADAFITPLGSWGKPSPYAMGGVEYFTKANKHKRIVS